MGFEPPNSGLHWNLSCQEGFLGKRAISRAHVWTEEKYDPVLDKFNLLESYTAQEQILEKYDLHLSGTACTGEEF